MDNYHIYPNVHIGSGAHIGHYVIIGEPPQGKKDGELPTIIGEKALIRSATVIYAGNRIGENFQTGHHVLIREDNEIGNNVSIGSGSVVEFSVVIEDNVRIHSGAFIPEYCVLKKGCWIGPCVVLTNVYHPLCPKAKKCRKGATIGVGAKIGANATILPDITIGSYSLVGAGSLVTKDVPPNSVVAGNPARMIKRIDDLRCPYGLIERPYEIDRKEKNI